MYPLLPSAQPWVINEQTKVKANRTGLLLIPDSSATAHMLQGATLQAAIVDCLEHGHSSKLADMLAASVGLSRVKLKSAVLMR